jgi:hypothetical protein
MPQNTRVIRRGPSAKEHHNRCFHTFKNQASPISHSKEKWKKRRNKTNPEIRGQEAEAAWSRRRKRKSSTHKTNPEIRGQEAEAAWSRRRKRKSLTQANNDRSKYNTKENKKEEDIGDVRRLSHSSATIKRFTIKTLF